jgi:hypothetical protein
MKKFGGGCCEHREDVAKAQAGLGQLAELFGLIVVGEEAGVGEIRGVREDRLAVAMRFVDGCFGDVFLHGNDVIGADDGAGEQFEDVAPGGAIFVYECGGLFRCFGLAHFGQ